MSVQYNFKKDTNGDTIFGTQAQIDSGNYFRITANGDIYIVRAGEEKYITTYKSVYASGLVTPDAIGGIPAGTDVSTLTDKTSSQLWDMLLFPTIVPRIKIAASISYSTNLPGGIIEVGVALHLSLTAVFNRGLIENGNGTDGPLLVGNATTYTFNGTGMSPTVTPTPILVLDTAYVAGVNRFDIVIAHAIGTGVYYDSKGDTSTILDSSRVASSILKNSNSVNGIYPFFQGMSDVNLLVSGTTLYTNLTKDVVVKSNKSYLLNGTVKNVYIAYDNSYGDLSQILDGSGFVQDLADWTKQDVSVTSTGLHTNWTKTLRVYKSKASVSVVNQTYQFRF